METRNIRTETDEVNRPGSKIWLMMNDNSKAKFLRDQFISRHGGSFYRAGRGWKWRSPVTEKNGYWLKKVQSCCLFARYSWGKRVFAEIVIFDKTKKILL